MSDLLVSALTDLRIEVPKWRFVDLRIDIPAGSFGSDAINPHTQYSNPIALMEHGQDTAIGAAFTLGAGNDMVCKGAEYILSELNGHSVGELISSKSGFYEVLTNPLQLRWLSPNAGLPLMAAGLVVNTLLDAASKSVGLPTWEYLARLPSDLLLALISLRHLDDRYDLASVRHVLDRGLSEIDKRCLLLKEEGLPVYYTTWIGHDPETITQQIISQHRDRGINTFKLKISPDIDHDSARLKLIRESIPAEIELCVDANQTLSLDEGKRWLRLLSDYGVKWLEEPFAPDNILLFEELVRFKRFHKLECEVVSGENCPNHFTASALIDSGIDRFQPDPCRMLGLVDDILVCIIASMRNCTLTPHAGGSSLDELSPHIQLFNLARIRTDMSPAQTLTENVGFCSRYFAEPTIVENGRAKAPLKPGLLVGVADSLIEQMRDYKEGISWLEL
jgi:L-alanine-DL-glutamate epimerase-like enolase superfamily enzyme